MKLPKGYHIVKRKNYIVKEGDLVKRPIENEWIPAGWVLAGISVEVMNRAPKFQVAIQTKRKSK